VADEVVDLAIPALFFWLRRHRWRTLRAGSVSRAPPPRLPEAQTG